MWLIPNSESLSCTHFFFNGSRSRAISFPLGGIVFWTLHLLCNHPNPLTIVYVIATGDTPPQESGSDVGLGP